MIEDDLTSCESAVREGFEEGGIRGIAYDRPIGQYQHKKWNGTCNVEVFLFKVYNVLTDWPEAHFRRRTWQSVEVAAMISTRTSDNPEYFIDTPSVIPPAISIRTFHSLFLRSSAVMMPKTLNTMIGTKATTSDGIAYKGWVSQRPTVTTKVKTTTTKS
jgi:hypothetical protein